MLKSMRSSVTESGIMGNSEERKIIQSMFDEKLADRIGEQGGIGIGKILFEQLKNRK
jgi:flagellar protein FlgJ